MKKIISLCVLCHVGGAYANTSVIYPDQLKVESFGAGICSTDFRAITKPEAETYRNEIVNKMGKWQITALADGWVIMGSGYSGEIKRSSASNTWCYPNTPMTEIPELNALFVNPGSKNQIEWALVNNKASFVKPLSYLAHYMGFAWVGGNRSNYVGEDMEITKANDEWKIQGYNGGDCSGYRCDEKTAISVSNFEYVMDTESYRVKGEIVTSDKELQTTISVPATNDTSVAQMTVVTIEYDAQTNWSKTNDYSVSESVTLSNTWKSPSVTGGADTSLSVTISAEQAWGSSNGGSTAKKVVVQARTNIPPYTSLNAKLDLFTASISYPYEFDADIAYNLSIDGFMRWGGNALLNHPEDRPTDNASFVIGRWAGEDNSIEYQWEHRYIPGVNKKWDWPWMIEQTSLSTMKYWLSNILRPKKTTLSGNFYAQSQFAGNVYFGDERPIPQNLKTSRSVIPSSNDISNSESLKQQLEDAGFKNVKVKIEIAN
ncbi:aerolysin family beta-barrel pore-forming toxin [Pseudoalteromonas denitrificans]|uniref:Aerolysin/Pertussis toxin (APT) domain-containing protein n=1 Tax=Pseudoalteromonas denitrificans DSM 6059 TaxID=1123010 RepID=A0A1I1MTF1_9GAMM|nr:aerolysin family beta-barrel pore-forming toxin [Pseudoalteromonas denitrificans]SFC88415.1 Aerolysin/Pertussis toxin (APT) domain-containing protein [Pseudoalteromonas denitrificans DSM 6059]